MGSGSSQLKCPNDYDKEKFEKIMKLYDSLDSNGDHVIETDELNKIADLHVRNKIRKLKENIDNINSETETKNKILENDISFKIAELNTQLIIKQTRNLAEKDDLISFTNSEIDKLQSMPKEKKSEKFMEAVTTKNGNIDFWKFFDYMKSRTQDIDNIVW
jgi:Ca2+-binding EF-hand superfamily protein